MPDHDVLDALPTPALIARIVERFHEAHRRDLPALAALARELGEPGAELAAHVGSMAEALELHMFKEEMRLFPMMEQGGGRLVGHLIDDLVPEHRAHEDGIARLEALVAALPAPPGRDGTVDALRAGAASLVAGLVEHIRLEDTVLFRRFDAFPRTAGLIA